DKTQRPEPSKSAEGDDKASSDKRQTRPACSLTPCSSNCPRRRPDKINSSTVRLSSGTSISSGNALAFSELLACSGLLSSPKAMRLKSACKGPLILPSTSIHCKRPTASLASRSDCQS